MKEIILIFPFKKLIYVLLFGVSLMSCGRKAFIHKISNTPLNQEESIETIYYSDYLSFAGEDSQGRVLFAIDNNRWKEKEKFYAENFLAFYDSQDGWIKLTGVGKFPNEQRELKSFVSSDDFKFEGNLRKNFKITSQSNDIVLEVDQLSINTETEKGLLLNQMLSGAAILKWKGRTIKGRLINEKLRIPHFAKKVSNFMKLGRVKFDGVYAVIPELGDFYFHTATSKKLNEGFIPPQEGFVRLPDQLFVADSIISEPIENHKKAFYKLSTSWQGELELKNESISYHIKTTDLNIFNNMILGGFAMGAVEGELNINGKIYDFYGFSELISF